MENEKQGIFLNDNERLLVIFKKLKAYLEKVRPELIDKHLLLHYSKHQDAFMLTMIVGVEWSSYYKKTCFDYFWIREEKFL